MNRDCLFGNKFVNIRDEKLFLGKKCLLDLISQYPSPFFIFIKEKIEQNISQIQNAFQKVFPKSVGFYSIKSNYLPEIVEILKDQGFGAQIISLPEFNLLQKKQFSHDKILLGGPYLPDNLIDKVIEQQIPWITIYDIDDLNRIQSKCQNKEYKINIILRFSKPKYTGRQGIRYDLDNIRRIIQIFQKSPNLIYQGVASHIGSQLNQESSYLENFEFLHEIARSFQIEGGFETLIYNIGGGFPNADSLPYKNLIKILSNIKNQLNCINWDKITIFYEPGRYIVGDAGFCVSSIIKFDPAINTNFLDIGIQFLPKFMRSTLRFYNIEHITSHHNRPIDFMGNLPSDDDVIIKNFNFSEDNKTGNHVLIANVGAYALTFSTRFPYPIPTILLLSEDSIKILYNSGDPSDISLIC